MKAILDIQNELTKHPLYETLKDVESIRHFMRSHVFAVWDFMSLLKSLQRHITCIKVPWQPSAYSTEMVRFINQIVLGEESDVDSYGTPISHFELYLKAMDEVGASTSEIRDFLTNLDLNQIPQISRPFVEHNLNVALHGDVVEVAASFFFGREKLIPDMFQSMVEILRRENVEAPTFIYYLQRHIEVDSEEHGPLALKCLAQLTHGDPALEQLAEKAGLAALSARKQLWDATLASLKDLNS